MSFTVQALSTLRLSVANIAQSRDWYASFFRIAPSEDSENFVSFQFGQQVLEIVAADAKSPQSTGGSVGYWLVDDLDAAVAKAIELNGKIYRGPLEVKEIQRTILQIINPLGDVIGLEANMKDLQSR